MDGHPVLDEEKHSSDEQTLMLPFIVHRISCSILGVLKLVLCLLNYWFKALDLH